MRLTVLGGAGAWSGPGQGCSGYLVEHDGFRLLLDPGYATLPALLSVVTANGVDAVLISHGHPDHCADLGALLRARVLGDEPSEPLQVYAPARALDRMLSAEPIRRVREAADITLVRDGTYSQIGPFAVNWVGLPHHVTNLGMRITADRQTLAYTGDSGPTAERIDLGKGVDLLLAEATWPEEVPALDAAFLCSAVQVAQHAVQSYAVQTVLTHLRPGTDRGLVTHLVEREGLYGSDVAVPGLIIDLDPEPTIRPRRSQTSTGLGALLLDRRSYSEGRPRRAAGGGTPD